MRLSFVLGSGLRSRAIAWWGQGYGGYSHVDAILPDGTLLGARSDNVGGGAGVRVRRPNYEKWKRRAIVSIPCTAIEETLWLNFLMSQCGTPYDSADILGLIIGYPLMSAGHWICSALQKRALIKAGKFPANMPETDQQTPPDMLLFGTMAIGGVLTL